VTSVPIADRAGQPEDYAQFTRLLEAMLHGGFTRPTPAR